MSPHATRGGIVFFGFMAVGAIQMKENVGMHIMRAILIAAAIAFASIALSGCVSIGDNSNDTVNASSSEADGSGKLQHYPVIL